MQNRFANVICILPLCPTVSFLSSSVTAASFRHVFLFPVRVATSELRIGFKIRERANGECWERCAFLLNRWVIVLVWG